MIHRIALLVLASAGFFAAAPAAGKQLPIVPDGIEVGGVPVGGLISVQAQAKVERTYGKPLRLAHGDERWNVGPARFGADAAIEDAIAAAVAAEPNASVDVEVVVRKKAVKRYVEELERRFGVEPRDAALVGLDDAFAPRYREAKAGLSVDEETMVRRITKALRSPVRGKRIQLATVPVEPAVTEADLGSLVVIRRGSNELSFWNGGTLVRTFTVATGKAQYPTPLGRYQIIDLQRHPWWYPPDSDWARGASPVPPGPGNPLGTRWMGIDSPAVGIHGTPDAASLGYSVSHGCIRMAIPEAEWLFERVDVGTPVYIVAA